LERSVRTDAMTANYRLFVPYVFGLEHRPIPYQYENVVRHLDPSRFAVTCLAERDSQDIDAEHVFDVRLPEPNSTRRRWTMARAALRGYDVLQTGGSPIARYLLTGLTRIRNPELRHVHTVHIDISEEQTRRRRFKRCLARSADEVVAVSEHTAGTVRRQFDVAPTVVHNGIDVDYFRPDRPKPDLPALSSEPTFLFVGRLDRRKRPLDVVEVAREVPETTFLIRGGGPLSKRVAAAADEIDNLETLGRLEKATLADLYANVTGLLFPSVREGCPTVVLEALASGTPVVGYEATAMPELVSDGETGYLVAPTDVGELADAVRALTDSAVARRMGAAAREHALEHHRFDHVADRYRELYLGGD